MAEICGELKRFGLTLVHGDRYGADILAERFRDNGIGYRHSDKSKSDLYLELLPLLNSNQVELLEGQRLINQFANLERTSPGAASLPSITRATRMTTSRTLLRVHWSTQSRSALPCSGLLKIHRDRV